MDIVKKGLSAILYMFFCTAYTQFNVGERLPIDLDLSGSHIARSGDLDGDGDIDIVAGFFDGFKWYENLDGQGAFGAPNLVADGLVQVFGAVVLDIDGDGDLDIAGTSFDLGTAFWYENIDGLGTFSTQRLISNQFVGGNAITSADLDNDGDFDIIVNSSVGNELAWFENLDGQGGFGPLLSITTTVTNGRSVAAGDLDNDGDMDIVSSNATGNPVVWFENMDGQGFFNTGHIIENESAAVEEVALVDLDGDGDLDVVYSVFSEDTLAWIENLDGLGDFSSRRVISTMVDAIIPIDTADIDNDGDFDVLAVAADFPDGGLIWFENRDGQGSFNEGTFIDQPTTSTRSVHATDIDGDNDIDIVVPILFDDVLVWYENQTLLGIGDVQIETVRAYPNPVEDILQLEIPKELSAMSISVYNTLGQEFIINSLDNLDIDLSALPRGVYFIVIATNQGEIVKKILKQ